jgi:hypothetical protein
MKHKTKEGAKELGEKFYMNVVLYRNQDKWCPAFSSEHIGSTKWQTAVRMRKNLANYLEQISGGFWKNGENIKTVVITNYNKHLK